MAQWQHLPSKFITEDLEKALENTGYFEGSAPGTTPLELYKSLVILEDNGSEEEIRTIIFNKLGMPSDDLKIHDEFEQNQISTIDLAETLSSRLPRDMREHIWAIEINDKNYVIATPDALRELGISLNHLKTFTGFHIPEKPEVSQNENDIA